MLISTDFKINFINNVGVGSKVKNSIGLKNDSGQPKLISDEAAYYVWTPLGFRCCNTNIYERGKLQSKIE